MSDSDIVGPEAIRDGVTTDAYFEWTEATFRHAGKDSRVVAEVMADQFPDDDLELFAGVKDAMELLAGRDIDADTMPGGTLFDEGPVMRIEGDYLGFARLETSFLGFLSHASGCVTVTLEARSVASDSTALSFGVRHVHPVITTMVERSALVAGLDGFSRVIAGEILGKETSGVMPHALLIALRCGNQVETFRAFDRAVNGDMPRVVLCDIYGDETEGVLQAVEAFGDDLDSVRPDTTSSRRGDFRHIVCEVRWELDTCGHEDVDIFVSGGLGSAEPRHLRDAMEGLGIGGHISNADPVDFALDIVEVNGGPAARRGRLSSVKEVYRMADSGHHVGLYGWLGPTNGESLLESFIRDGEVISEFDFDIDAAATRANEDAESVGFGGVSEE